MLGCSNIGNGAMLVDSGVVVLNRSMVVLRRRVMSQQAGKKKKGYNKRIMSTRKPTLLLVSNRFPIPSLQVKQ